jgi:hypothetical protein
MPWRALTGYQEVSVDNYPKVLVPPVPSSGDLAVLGGEVVLDTTKALHVWNGRTAPPHYIPVADVKPGVLVDEQHIRSSTSERPGGTDCGSANSRGRALRRCGGDGPHVSRYAQGLS